MNPIHCKRPALLLPKAIGETHVFNFFGPAGLLAVITVQGRIYIAQETADGITLRTQGGEKMDKGPVFRFIKEHLQALKDGAVPASLTSAMARQRSTTKH